MDRFNAAGKIFKGNSYWFQSQAAYRFLKKYIGTQKNRTVRYSPDCIFPYEEFQNDNVTLGDQVELIVSEENKQEVQSLKAQKDQIEADKIAANKAIQNLQTQLEREQNKNKFLMQQLEEQQQAQTSYPSNPPAK